MKAAESGGGESVSCRYDSIAIKCSTRVTRGVVVVSAVIATLAHISWTRIIRHGCGDDRHVRSNAQRTIVAQRVEAELILHLNEEGSIAGGRHGCSELIHSRRDGLQVNRNKVAAKGK